MDNTELINIRQSLGLTQTQFADLLGVSRSTITNWERGDKIPMVKIKRIREIADKPESIKPVIVNKNDNKFKELGDGSMLMTVDLIPISASAKYITELLDNSAAETEWEEVSFIVDGYHKGNYKGFKADGDSMWNENDAYSTPDKARVLGRELLRHHWMDGFHEAPRGWIIITHQNILFKEIVDFDKSEGTITCHSKNPHPQYSDFKVNLNEVHQIFKVCQRSGF